MKNRFKKKLKDNGQSLKWFWLKHLKGKITYSYFNMQVNENADMQPDIEKAITDFMMGGRKYESK